MAPTVTRFNFFISPRHGVLRVGIVEDLSIYNHIYIYMFVLRIAVNSEQLNM